VGLYLKLLLCLLLPACRCFAWVVSSQLSSQGTYTSRVWQSFWLLQQLCGRSMQPQRMQQLQPQARQQQQVRDTWLQKPCMGLVAGTLLRSMLSLHTQGACRSAA
jgi:hypothetical protein